MMSKMKHTLILAATALLLAACTQDELAGHKAMPCPKANTPWY